MIAVDTNLLIYAHREDSEFHDRSVAVMQDLVESGRRWSIPWPCVHEFLAITTHPRIYSPPTPSDIALESLEVWVSVPTCEMIGEGPGYLEVLKNQVLSGRIAGPMVHDARIAALCIHHGVQTFWTADRDFSRFASLKTHNPLVAGP